MDPTWLAVTFVLTVLGGLWTVYAWRARGVAAALRGAGITLLAPAAYLTGILELAGGIAADIGDWASRLVLSPVVWAGIGLAGGGVLLFLLGGLLSAREIGTTPRPRAPRVETAERPDQLGGGTARPTTPPAAAPAAGRPAARPAARPAGKPTAKPADDDMDDIEAILRRRGIE